MSQYQASGDRYAASTFRRAGHSGLDLPAVSLGLWHNFGDAHSFASQRAILLRAFDRGVTHVDLANNYGPPPGAAEATFGRVLATDLRPYRDELVISTKAGYDMWPGPYGDGGSAKYLTASLDASLRRTGLDHVDIFYSHRPDPSVPIEETAGALARAVRQGKALYVGISNYSPAEAVAASRALTGLGVPLLIQQESYSMFDRHVEQPVEMRDPWLRGDAAGAPGRAPRSLLETVEELAIGLIVFSPLAQGLLTDRYLDGRVAAGSRASVGHFLKAGRIDEEYLARARALNDIAAVRGQSLAQLAITWLLRDERVTSVLVGASSVRQLEDNLAALEAAPLTTDEIEAIEPWAVDMPEDD
ncbi:aldo/keto reductase [Georgenia sp. SYP-B2076]|uniref:aldo/keto reductase n=1 Tax=Georgenia sp. SYP-B2076 TaxID=2495881 RepID=UPI000F8CB498|nr:aldo/keto reductase [Georgenia sp. SYP-B2076]